MLNRFKNVILIWVTLFSVGIYAQQTPNEIVLKMGRGINLGNVLSAPTEGNWSGPATEEYFSDVANAGFSNVRIPIDFFGDRTSGSTASYSTEANTTFNGSRNDFVVNSNYLDRIEQIIEWGLSKGLVIVLDLHGATLKSEFIYTFDSQKAEYTHPTSAKRSADLAKFYSIWEQISKRFKDYSDDLIFELINEPYFHISAADMNIINRESVSTIRSSGGNNATRKIILTGGTKTSYQAITTIENQLLSDDDYIIATFHYYRPFRFTKSSSYRYNDNQWGDENDKSNLDNEFDIVLSWANSFNPPVAVYLGEFGADNYNGYSYQTGDLHVVTENRPSNSYPDGTGYSDGGPDLQSRVDFHGYIADAAISRGFSFSVWDAGGEASKTVHLRKDSGLTIYDFNYFSVESFVPKNTTPSTVLEQSKWVDDVKNALLFGYKGITCTDTEIIKNIDFECGYSTEWTFQTLGDQVEGTYQNALGDSRSGTLGAKISISKNDVYNKAILKNITVNDPSVYSGKTIEVKFFAKASTENQKIKIRFKHITSGNASYTPSQELALTMEYTQDPLVFSFEVPDNTSELQLQVLFGAYIGDYFIDDFSLEITNTLSNNTFSESNAYCRIENNEMVFDHLLNIDKINVYDIGGRLIYKTKKKRLPLVKLENKPYLIYIETDNKTINFKFLNTN